MARRIPHVYGLYDFSDIVRDFTLASRTSVELQELQQSFIQTLLSSGAAKSGGSHAFYTYAINSLAYHVRAAVSTPLASAGAVASLLYHDDPSIVAQALCGVHLADVIELAEHHEQAGTESGYWCAARLYFAVASTVAGLGVEEQSGFYLKALAAVKHVRSKLQSGALTLEIKCRNKVLFSKPTEEQATEMATAMFAIAKNGTGDIHTDDEKGLKANNFYVGLLLLGFFKTSYSLSASLAQVKKGGLSAM
jgi:hypothetical protein